MIPSAHSIIASAREECPAPPLHILLPPSSGLIQSPKFFHYHNSYTLPKPTMENHIPQRSSSLLTLNPSTSVVQHDRLPHTSLDASSVGRSSGEHYRLTVVDNQLQKIPKPKGEFGKPNCGGYSIQEAAKWNDDDYMSIRVSTYLCLLPLSLRSCNQGLG